LIRTRRLSFLAAAGAALVAPRVSRAAEGARFTVGIVPGDAAGVPYYAQELGFFRDAGLDAQASILDSGPAIAAALAGGSLDIGGVNVGSLASAHLRGIPLQIVAPAAVVGNGPVGELIMVRRDSTARNGADLNGKVVAVNALRVLQHAAALAWIDLHGGDSKSVKFIEIPSPAMPAALDAQRVDAVVTSEPWTTQGIGNNRALGTLYDGFHKPTVVFALCAMTSWLKKNASTAVKFASAFRQAALWANAPANEKERRRLDGIFTKQSDPVLLAKMALFPMGTSLSGPMLQSALDVMLKYGFLDRAVDPNDLIWKP
jgi:NitT/TauT family transport system substrate-binding protein